MVAFNHLTPTKKRIIISSKNYGQTSQGITEELVINQSTVSQYYRKSKGMKNWYETKHRLGAPIKFTDKEARFASILLKTGQDCNATDLRNKCYPNMATQTI